LKEAEVRGVRQHAPAIRWLARVPSFSGGAVVMATGVVSLCFHTTGPRWLSRLLLAVAAAVWAVLMTVFLTRALTDRERWAHEAGLPSALTLVAGTAVLGSRLSAADRPGLAQALMAAGVVLWAILLPPVLRRWSTPTVGTSLLVCVAPQALAVLAARVARGTGQQWELYVAAAAYALGLVAYAMVVRRFDFRQVLGGAGDQWVLAGALAITALAGSELWESSTLMGATGSTRTTLHVSTLLVGAAAAIVYVPLAAAEAIRPRVGFDMRRWSTVFPLGMAALTSLQLSVVLQEHTLSQLGKILAWLALAVWTIVATGSLRHAKTIASSAERI
jgi:tellurite resistance protein TehA-like permease